MIEDVRELENEDWSLVIRPKYGWFDVDLLELWTYRDLLYMFVKRDFVSFYKQTVLGPLWFFIQPLFMTIVFTFVFGNLAGLSTDGLPQPLFYLAGITAWNYFADCITKTSTVFKDNFALFSKVFFPRLIMPLSIVTSNLIRFGVQMVLFFGMMAYFAAVGGNFHITAGIALVPLLVVLMALLGLGMGLTITAMTTRYRDLSFLVTFGVQLLMYVTTVIYPLSAAPERYRWLIELNPMTAIIEAFRYAFLGQGNFGFFSLGYSVVATLVILTFGVLIFSKAERNFVDTV